MKRIRGHCICLLGLLAFPAPPSSPGSLEWPLGSGKDPYPLAQTYGQFQGGCGAGAGFHLGLDIYPKQSVEQVFAIEDGIVKHVDCFKEYHSGLLVESEAQPGEGFLYLHLDPKSIQVGFNAKVEKGMLLGTVVPFEADNWVGTHLHLGRLAGYTAANLAVNELPADSYSIADPLKLIDPLLYGDHEAPKIHEIFVRKNELAGGTAPDVLPPLEVTGVVDIVAQVTDEDDTYASTLAPSTVRVDIRDEDGALVHQASICFEGHLPSVLEPTYTMDSCGVGRPSPPEFYFIATNGSEGCALLPSIAQGWSSEEGKYEVTVTAQDAAGNEAQESIPIEVP